VKEKKKKGRWGFFHYFVIISSVTIMAMWAGILCGGRPAPPRTIDLTRHPEFVLFMVDVAIKRYAHYEGNEYPETLSDLIPKYVPLGKHELLPLGRLSYRRNAEVGYYLLLGDPETGGALIILSPQGIAYSVLSKGGSR